MSDSLNEAKAVLRRARQEIAALMAQSTAEERFRELAELAGLAAQLADVEAAFAQDKPAVSSAREHPSREERANVEPRPVEGLASPAENLEAGQLDEDQSYPRFFREGDDLVKVGLSRGGDSTYEHRIPKNAMETIANRVRSAGGNGEPFTAESLSDVRPRGDNSKIPGYQLYLCLGWFKRLDLVVKNGRRGYSLRNPDSFTENVRTAWESLAESPTDSSDAGRRA